MELMIYASPLNAAGQLLLKTLCPPEKSLRLDICPSLAALEARLRKPIGRIRIGILLPANRRELAALNRLRHLLRDMRLILILPNTQPQTVSEGHALRPRFIGYIDDDPQDVAAVVHKMTAARSRPVSMAL